MPTSCTGIGSDAFLCCRRLLCHACQIVMAECRQLFSGFQKLITVCTIGISGISSLYAGCFPCGSSRLYAHGSWHPLHQRFHHKHCILLFDTQVAGVPTVCGFFPRLLYRRQAFHHNPYSKYLRYSPPLCRLLPADSVFQYVCDHIRFL